MFQAHRVLPLLAVLCAGLGAPLLAQDVATPALDLNLDPALEERVAKKLEEHRAEQELVGLAAAVIVRGEIVYSAGFGLADREKNIPVTSDTLFRWASISKPVTAVAALQLVESGALDLERDVREYVPEFPEKPWPITARDILCHQSGIVHYRNGKVIRTERKYDTEHPFEDVVLALDTFKDSPLVHDPGRAFSYTTHGYILLSAVVQRAGGAPFSEQVAQRVAEPLGMTTFQPDYQWRKIPQRAVGYTKFAGRIVRSTNTDVSWKLGGGGFLSNVDDLARFVRGLLGSELLEEDTLREMWKPRTTRAGKNTGYGLGFRTTRLGSSLRTGHGGSQEKTRTLSWLFPERELGIVLMSNSEYAQLQPIATEITTLLGALPD